MSRTMSWLEDAMEELEWDLAAGLIGGEDYDKAAAALQERAQEREQERAMAAFKDGS